MENKQQTLLAAVEKIYTISKNSGLVEKEFSEIENELKLVSNFFQINTIQSILLATIICETFDTPQDLSRIATHLGVLEIRLMRFISDFEELLERRIIQKSKKVRISKIEYCFNPALLTFLIENRQIPLELTKKEIKEQNFQQFLKEIDELSKLKDENEICDKWMFDHQLWKIVEQYKNSQLVNYIIDTMNRSSVDVFVFLDTIIDAIKSYDNNFNTGLQSTVDDCTFSHRDSFEYVSRFISGKTLLNKLNLVEKDNTAFGNSHNLRLTDKAIKMLREWEGIKFEITEKNDKLLYPCKIKPIDLIYNPNEKEQLDIIMKSMPNSMFKQFQKRLRATNLPAGITTLFYGAPGTGKTETVYQIAKKYNRPVFKVDISETKSMWFGESQKIVKKIFTDYYECKKSEKVCPILLFNEADAVISKRKMAGSSNVADTENAIQNILLEELENFDGILFATSNLINNIDSAFERRFLFKIQFEVPNQENASKIWQSKLPLLSKNEAFFLVNNFRFSGGEMENIARKCLMEEVVTGDKSTFEQIVRFCENEKWDDNIIKIGF